MELHLTTERKYKKNDYTIGKMTIGTVDLWDTLEDKDRGLTSDMSVLQIMKAKVFGKTAIPTGTYRIELTVSPKFGKRPWAVKYGGLVPLLIGVKGFSGIRIHPLTDASQTDGCIGVGENKVKGKLVNSVATYYKLMDEYLMPAYRRGDAMFITIK